jgi:hypothetical protein
VCDGDQVRDGHARIRERLRLIIKLIKKGVPVKRVNLIYLAYRKLYTLLISAPSAVS